MNDDVGNFSIRGGQVPEEEELEGEGEREGRDQPNAAKFYDIKGNWTRPHVFNRVSLIFSCSSLQSGHVIFARALFERNELNPVHRFRVFIYMSVQPRNSSLFKIVPDRG